MDKEIFYRCNTDGDEVWKVGGKVGYGRSKHCSIAIRWRIGREDNQDGQGMIKRNHEHITIIFHTSTDHHAHVILCDNVVECTDRFFKILVKYSPREIVMGNHLDLKKNCKIVGGSCVEVHG